MRVESISNRPNDPNRHPLKAQAARDELNLSVNQLGSRQSDQTHFIEDIDGLAEGLDGLQDERSRALADSFGGGLKTLVNPSAALERDCAEILAAAGQEIPADIDTRTTMVAAPCGGGCMQSVAVTGMLGLRETTPALHTLESNALVATQSYKGQLPPKVQRHLDLARSAAQRLGSQPCR